MINFKQFVTLYESAQNKHIEHIEDNIFNNGSQGVDDAVNMLRTLAKTLHGNSNRELNFSTKFDGAPAIICGKDPESGRFFVATKSLFAKTPKVNYTVSDIRNNHSGELADILTLALRHLAELNIKGIVQGDLMFTDSRKTIDTIDGVKHIVFQPNTIAYAVPLASELGARIKRARIGIIFHTSYSGKSIADLKASYGVNINSMSKTPNVWFRDATFRDVSGSALFTQKEFGELYRTLKSIDRQKNAISSQLLNDISRTNNHKAYIKQYINSRVKGGSFDISTTDLIDFVTNILDKNIEQYKSAAAQTKAKVQKQFILNFFIRNKPSFDLIFKLYSDIYRAKMIVVRKMDRIQDLGTFMKTTDGYRVTSPEGFVAVDRIGNVVKLVDRLEFSNANFNVEKNWKK